MCAVHETLEKTENRNWVFFFFTLLFFFSSMSMSIDFTLHVASVVCAFSGFSLEFSEVSSSAQRNGNWRRWWMNFGWEMKSQNINDERSCEKAARMEMKLNFTASVINSPHSRVRSIQQGNSALLPYISHISRMVYLKFLRVHVNTSIPSRANASSWRRRQKPQVGAFLDNLWMFVDRAD